MNITNIIDELRELASTGTRVPGFRRKVMVDIDHIERLIAMGNEMQSSVPANLQESDEILKQKDSIINQAYLEAQRIKGTAEQQATSLTSSAKEEHESKVSDSEILKVAEAKGEGVKEEAAIEAHQIIQDAQRRAYRILNEAETATGARREGADQYAREVLFNLESNLADVLGQVRKGLDSLRLETGAQQISSGQPTNGQQVPA
ncbi:MAG: hypothetical protein IIC22_03410 [Chloroflexi bacterium]|nr:hypothetical protein [Chloroflexota bacterium]